MAGRYLFAFPCKLDYLCNYGSDLTHLHKNVIIPLCWLGFGSVKELMEWPISLLNRYSKIMEEEGMMDKFRSFKDPYYKSRFRGLL